MPWGLWTVEDIGTQALYLVRSPQSYRQERSPGETQNSRTPQAKREQIIHDLW